MSMMSMMGGPQAPPQAPQGPPSGGGGNQGADILRMILDLADAYRSQEDSEQNLLMVEQLRTLAQKILAEEEKGQESMLMGKMTPGTMRRAAGQMGGSGY